MNKIKYNLKKLLSFPRLVKFLVKSFLLKLIKGRVVEHKMKLLILKNFYSVHKGFFDKTSWISDVIFKFTEY